MFKKLKKIKNFYRLMYPRLVGILVAKYNNRLDLLPITWHSPVSSEELLFVFSIRTNTLAYEILKLNPKFTLNVLPSKYLEDVWKINKEFGMGIDKSGLIRFTLKDGDFGVPHIKEAIAYIEGLVEDRKLYGNNALLICRVVGAYYKDAYFNGEVYFKSANLLLHLGKDLFVELGNGKIIKPKIQRF